MKEKFYLNSIKNLTSESSYTSIINSTCYDFFNKHNLLTKNPNNNLKLNIEINKIFYESKILQQNFRATSSELHISVTIKVKKSEKEIFRKTYNDSNNYTIFTNITQTYSSKHDALIKSLNNILLDFINDFKKENTYNR
ncbi:hypothetical protein [Deferribacter abyssi]|uniref:hypothetical protein n=1 Tax=Deferribacter abyssi TaxID=213806 RepID=UPI003C13C6B6